MKRLIIVLTLSFTITPNISTISNNSYTNGFTANPLSEITE